MTETGSTACSPRCSAAWLNAPVTDIIRASYTEPQETKALSGLMQMQGSNQFRLAPSEGGTPHIVGRLVEQRVVAAKSAGAVRQAGRVAAEAAHGRPRRRVREEAQTHATKLCGPALGCTRSWGTPISTTHTHEVRMVLSVWS